jgi:hypothetical protein
MNANLPLVLIILIGLLIVGLALVAFVRQRCGKQTCTPDYRGFFIIGLIWVPIGVVFYITSGNIAFLGMGMVFLLLGLANKAKWKESQPLTPGQRKLKIALVIGTVFLVLLTFAFWLFR